jgi:hypothetical protein
MIQTSIQSKNDSFTNQHIYITSDEEIKMDDWYLDETNSVRQAITECESYWTHRKKYQKIILTTDQDLIQDGVQAIDDEFLEWFVKNPSCEYVELTRDFADEGIKGITYYGKYFIIIPKEEPKQVCENCKQTISKYGCACGKQKEEQKQHLIDIMRGDEELGLYEEPKQENCCTPIGQIKRYVDCKGCDRKPKEETLEEADYEKLKQSLIEFRKVPMTFVPDERMYSEEDLLCAFEAGMMFIGEDKGSFKEWFEQFKNKL